METTNINDVLEYLDFQLHIELKRAKSEGFKFLIVIVKYIIDPIVAYIITYIIFEILKKVY